MSWDQLSSIVARVFFVGAFALLGVSILERVCNFLGYTFLRGYSPGRLLEYAAVLLIFILAIVLRQVRDQLRHTGA